MTLLARTRPMKELMFETFGWGVAAGAAGMAGLIAALTQ